jgi:RimJ/RimL family protein N-acetyltransferase
VTLIYGQDERVAKWVGEQLMKDAEAFTPCRAIGIERNGGLIAGVVYNKYEPNLLIEMSIASLDKRWATRHTLRALFVYPFIQLNLKRVQALCSAKDEGVIMFLKKLGFTHEGTHPCAFDDGGTALSFGMLKHQCRWL